MYDIRTFCRYRLRKANQHGARLIVIGEDPVVAAAFVQENILLLSEEDPTLGLIGLIKIYTEGNRSSGYKAIRVMGVMQGALTDEENYGNSDNKEDILDAYKRGFVCTPEFVVSTGKR